MKGRVLTRYELNVLRCARERLLEVRAMLSRAGLRGRGKVIASWVFGLRGD